MAQPMRLLAGLAAVFVLTLSATATNLPPGGSLLPLPGVTEVTDPNLSTGLVIYEGSVAVSQNGFNGVFRDRVIQGPLGNLIFMDALYNGFDDNLNPIASSGYLLSISHSDFAGFTVDAAYKVDGLDCPVGPPCSIIPPDSGSRSATGDTLTWNYNVPPSGTITQWTLAGTNTSHYDTNGTADINLAEVTGLPFTIHLTGIAEPAVATPEPGTMLLLCLGLGATFARRRQ